MRWEHVGTIAILGLGSLAVLPSCTSYIQPTVCDKGATACGGINDARFCDDIAVAVEGQDCASLGIAEAKHFCVVTTKCIDATYAVADRDCRVLRYQGVSDTYWANCEPGAPTFVIR
jgi:hypothetical protein